QNLSRFRLAERRPALAHGMMASFISWSFSNSMFRYLLIDHRCAGDVAQPCGGEVERGLTASGNAPKTCVRRRISRRIRDEDLWSPAPHSMCVVPILSRRLLEVFSRWALARFRSVSTGKFWQVALWKAKGAP